MNDDRERWTSRTEALESRLRRAKEDAAAVAIQPSLRMQELPH